MTSVSGVWECLGGRREHRCSGLCCGKDRPWSLEAEWIQTSIGDLQKTTMRRYQPVQPGSQVQYPHDEPYNRSYSQTKPLGNGSFPGKHWIHKTSLDCTTDFTTLPLLLFNLPYIQSLHSHSGEWHLTCKDVHWCLEKSSAFCVWLLRPGAGSGSFRPEQKHNTHWLRNSLSTFARELRANWVHYFYWTFKRQRTLC